MNRKLGRHYVFYRLGYNVVAGVGLLIMLVLNGAVPSGKLIAITIATRYVSMLLATAGVMIIIRSFREYSLMGFLGLRKESDAFTRSGILKYVRHPLYSGTILIIVGFWLFSPNVSTAVSAGCMLIYLAIGIQLEEKKLVKRYGEAYTQYKREVPMLVPRFW